MRSDGFNYKHCISFIMTANNNPLPVEMDDRRFAFINTPNKLEAQPWVKDMGGISNVQKVTTYPTSIHPVFYGI